MKNHYATLEVGVSDDVVVIRESYRRLIQEHLRDPKQFEELNQAYLVLNDSGKRAEFDSTLHGEPDSSAAEQSKMTNEPSFQPSGTALQCPMGAGSMCPVVNARVPLGDAHCPECGCELAQISAMAEQAAAPPAAQQGPSAWLQEDTGRQHPVNIGPNAVGRESNEIMLPDKTVSREHARVIQNPDGSVTVEDLASTNGTKINGERLTPHFPRPINHMDSVTFGSVLVRLHIQSSEQPAYAAHLEEPEIEMPSLLSAQPAVEADDAPRMLTNFDTEPIRPVSTGGKLIGVRGDSVEEYPLVEGVTTFGRLPGNSIIINNDAYVSGHHAQIITEAGTFRFTDVGSTNGSRLNGERVAPNEALTLANGDEIAIGGTIFRLENG